MNVEHALQLERHKTYTTIASALWDISVSDEKCFMQMNAGTKENMNM